MSQKKNQIRATFRNSCFQRDQYRCVLCGFQSTPEQAEEELDCHHITDRNLLVAGGYVPENGISLCAACHEKAEEFHKTGQALPGFSPEDLYARIGSSHEKAMRAAEGTAG